MNRSQRLKVFNTKKKKKFSMLMEDCSQGDMWSVVSKQIQKESLFLLKWLVNMQTDLKVSIWEKKSEKKQ